MVPTGEFGGRVGDDSDFYQQFADLPFYETGGVAARTMDSAARLADSQNLRNGVNIHATDSLHAYEEGINHLALMARWFYCDPVFLERCMIPARNMEKLTILTGDGCRHFRDRERTGLADLDRPREPAIDGHANPLMWHTALQFADYNRTSDRVIRETTHELAKADRIGIRLQSKAVTLIGIEQLTELEPIYHRADLALARREVLVTPGMISAKVHNIGSAAVPSIPVAVVDAADRVVVQKMLDRLAAPLDLVPKWLAFKMEVPVQIKDDWKLVVDPNDAVPEIYEGNDAVELKIPSAAGQ